VANVGPATSTVVAGLPLRFPIFRCVMLAGDFDTDEIIWVCELVWP